jgi:uncharacterized protein (TIGR00299 family) protein
VEYRADPAVKCGITGTHVTVTVNGTEEDEHLHDHAHEHHHEHEHDHDHHDHDHHDHADHGHHHHSSLHDVARVIADLPVSETVRANALAVYRRIAEAESRVHGVPVPEIHFHEVGTMDAVADVAAVCLLMERLAPEQVVVSPICVGSGQVRCAHGILPVPAPATAHILQGVPIYAGDLKGELCTPTGAALLRQFATDYGPMPTMTVEAVGYGMGKKDFPAANCVRAMLGQTAEQGDAVLELSCNLDDMTPEAVGFAMEALYTAGALEVWTIPAGMKKNRPGVLLQLLCKPEDRETLVRALFRHTATIGVREQTLRRHTLVRCVQTVQTPLGPVRRKCSTGWGVTREKYEADDLTRLARERGCGLDEILAALP